MQLYLFDGINGSLLYRKEYQGRANWTFAKRDQVGSSSGQFWQSSYGQEVNYQLQEAVQDLVAQLSCAPVTARVVGQNERGPTSIWAAATASGSGISSASSTMPISSTPTASRA